MITEDTTALGVTVLFFPEGVNDEGAVACSKTHMPDPDDENWVDTQSVEQGDWSRENEVDVPIYSSDTGIKQLLDELQLGGDLQYKFTTNILTAYLVGLFFRSADPLTAASGQFNPNQQAARRGWIIIVHRDQNGTQILAANLWGKLKHSGPLKTGAGEVVKHELTFMVLKNDLNTMSLGT